MERLTDLTVAQFTDVLASDAPAPGGGSVAALFGACGTALAVMTANLTIGKKKYADHWNNAESAKTVVTVSDKTVSADFNPCVSVFDILIF